MTITMNFQNIDAAQSPETQVNENFETIDTISVFGKRQPVTEGITWGVYGGRWGGFAVNSRTVTLQNSGSTFLAVHIATGSLTVLGSAANWNDTTNYARVYKITTVSSLVTAVEDHRTGPSGIIGGSGGGSGATEFKGLTFTSDVDSTADSDPGNGLFKWNNATQASATILYFDNQTADAVSMTTLWGVLTTTGFIHIQQSDDSTKWQLWRWTALPTDGTGYRKFTVTLMASGGTIADAKTCYVTFHNSPNVTGKHSVPVSASSMAPSATGGCAALSRIASAANQPDILSLDFDPTTQEYAQFSCFMPKSWNEGTITFKAFWSHAATVTNFGVTWDLQAVAVSNDDAIAVAFGTAVTTVDTGGTTNDLYVGPESAAITVGGTPAAEDTVFFRLSRVTGDGGDTMAIDARLHGIVIYITLDAENDA